MSKANININGMVYDLDNVTIPPSGRTFRDAWATPDQGVIQIDDAKKRSILSEKVGHEAQRRAVIAMGGDPKQPYNAILKQMDAHTKLQTLLSKEVGGTPLTGPETSEKAALQSYLAGISAIEAKRDALQAMPVIPENFEDDSYWS